MLANMTDTPEVVQMIVHENTLENSDEWNFADCAKYRPHGIGDTYHNHELSQKDEKTKHAEWVVVLN